MSRFSQHPKLPFREFTTEEAEAAIRGSDQSVGVDVIKGLTQPFSDSFDILDLALGNGDHAENDLGPGKALEKREIVLAMGVLDRHGVDPDILKDRCQIMIGFPWRFRIVIVGIEFVGITAANMDDAFGRFRHFVETTIEMLGATSQGLIEFSGENRLVHLNHGAAGIGEPTDLDVQGFGQCEAARGTVVFVELIGDAVANRHRPGTVILTGFFVADCATCQSRTRKAGPAWMGRVMVGRRAV